MSFHEIDPDKMFLMDFFIYQIRPFALPPDLRDPTPKPPPDVMLTATPWVVPPPPTKPKVLASNSPDKEAKEKPKK